MGEVNADRTESICPVCLARIDATRVYQGNEVFLVKECAEHGQFKTVIWRGEPALATWRRDKEPVYPELCYTSVEKGCPFDCGLCSDHRQLPCSVLLEITDRCNLSCAVCFADAGSGAASCAGERQEPSLERIAWLLERSMAAAGPSNLQLSGGEPTLRDDLPEIVEIARRIGYSFIQVNTNGIRLAADSGYLKRLQAAGLSSLFLQFDGVDDQVYHTLRGRALFQEKLQAIRNAGEAGVGVVLVPTLMQGVNTDAIGALVRQALQLAPTVRGIHFQPVSYFGRHPEPGGDLGRFTLPELMRCLQSQTDGLLKVADFSPPGCEHAHCSFHGTYLFSADGALRALGTGAKGNSCCSLDSGTSGVRQTVDTVSRRWKMAPAAPFSLKSQTLRLDTSCCSVDMPEPARVEGPLDLDTFLSEASDRTFTISAMAFQDAENLDMERLMGCCISVVSPDGKLIPFCAYNLTSREGKCLYR